MTITVLLNRAAIRITWETFKEYPDIQAVFTRVKSERLGNKGLSHTLNSTPPTGI